MENRLQQFLSAENISQSQLAECLGVARASVSHILSGRNKPSYDFLESLAIHFPTLNLEWLVTGKGKMYCSNSAHTGELFCKADAQLSESVGEEASDSSGNPDSVPDTRYNDRQLSVREQVSQPGRSIEKIILYYSDGTFTEIS